MNFHAFRQAGHWPTLVAAFCYFAMSVMVWVVLGPLSLYLAQELQLSLADKFEIIAVAILSGALLRIPVGVLADYIGTKRTGVILQLIVIAGLLFAWLFGLHSKLEIEIFGIIVLGASGAGFAVAMPLASRWYPPHIQGIALGIVGAGTVGVPISSLLVPSLAASFGWQSVFGILLVPVTLVFGLYLWAAKEAPVKPTPVTLPNYVTVVKDPDTWWFMFFYGITFGGFVGLGSTLPLYFANWFHVSGITAGFMAAAVGFCGALSRPVGGWVADRIGGIRSLQFLFSLAGLAYLTVAFLPQGAAMPGAGTGVADGWTITTMPGMAWVAMGIFFLGLAGLGMGNGAVFQLVPLRFRKEIGVMTGLVGAAGGLGGFVLAKTLGWSKASTGDFAVGFWICSALALVGLIGVVGVKKRWRTTWGAVSGARV